MDNKPWEYENTPDFAGSSYTFSPEAPQFVNVSANGDYIMMGNDVAVYGFDLSMPENSWQLIYKGEKITNAWYNRNDTFSIITEDNLIRLKEQKKLQEASQIEGSLCHWGDEHWLITYDKKNLVCRNAHNEKIAHTKIRGHILTVWEQRPEVFRILHLHNKKNRLILLEWFVKKNILIELDNKKIPCFSSLDRMLTSSISPLAQCTHAWPSSNGGRRIQLVPYGLSVSSEGLLTPCFDTNAWRPCLNKTSGLSHAKTINHALTATLACLNKQLDPCRSFSSSPYLITTRVDNRHIDIITTLWHRRISIDKATTLNISELDHALSQDSDKISLLLANWTGELPSLPKVGYTLLSDNFMPSYSSKTVPLFTRQLLQSKLKRLEPLVTNAILSAFQLDEVEDINKLDRCHKLINSFIKNPLMALLFLQAMESGDIPQQLRDSIDQDMALTLLSLSIKKRAKLPPEISNLYNRGIDCLLRSKSGKNICGVIDTLKAPVLNENHAWKLIRTLHPMEEKKTIAASLLAYFQRNEERFPNNFNTQQHFLHRLLHRLVFQSFHGDSDERIIDKIGNHKISLPSKTTADACLKGALRIFWAQESRQEHIIQLLIARRLAIRNPASFKQDMDILHMRNLAQSSSNFVLLIAWLNTLTTIQDLAKPSADQELILDSLLSSMLQKELTSQHRTPQIIINEIWQASGHLKQSLRWGLACSLALTSSRLGISLNLYQKTAGQTSYYTGISPEMLALQEYAGSLKNYDQEIHQAILEGMEIGEVEAKLSRAVSLQCRKWLGNGLKEHDLTLSESDSTEIYELAKGDRLENSDKLSHI